MKTLSLFAFVIVFCIYIIRVIEVLKKRKEIKEELRKRQAEVDAFNRSLSKQKKSEHVLYLAEKYKYEN